VSIGAAPALSAMRASSTLIATRSSDRSTRPPACPSARTITGRWRSIAAPKACSERPNSQGRISATTSCPAIVVPESARATSCEGLTFSPPKGSKPVRRTRRFIASPR
jgi:hypothetical protein